MSEREKDTYTHRKREGERDRERQFFTDRWMDRHKWIFFLMQQKVKGVFVC